MPILPPLPRPQRRRIHKIIHATRDKGHARRLMAILLLHEGRTITDVHHLTGAARSTIGRWLRWYRDEGIDALGKVRTSIPRTKNENFSHLISMGYQ
ncbi:helix-turn-helix domain-containing protein [Aeromonas caviae]|uniref:helix-turn-helix domain-containing protein n=1 Tax=Aeromonas caviae TaxID=648 RepID=UPI0029DE5CC8|nr:helix-turn-helix domain-containing protein [Aeromonas caviae]MDX7645110.1 helix-turn-helix domain-containing protein [Aeromonas caviae]